MPHAPQPLMTLIVIVLLLLLYWRLRRMLRPARLKLGRLWIRPAILLVLAGLALLAPHRGAPRLTGAEWGGLAVAALLGMAAGWWMGRNMAIEVHPDDGTLMTRGNVAAIMVIVALVLVKLGMRPLLAMEGGHLDVLLITDGLIVFSVALFTARSAEMFLRARIIMRQAGK